MQSLTGHWSPATGRQINPLGQARLLPQQEGVSIVLLMGNALSL